MDKLKEVENITRRMESVLASMSDDELEQAGKILGFTPPNGFKQRLENAIAEQERLTSPIGKRVRWHPVDIDETFEGTIAEDRGLFYVVVPDNSFAPTQNWNKRRCEIISDS